MAGEANTNQPTTSAVAEAPAKDQATLNAEMAASVPAMVPAKFKDANGIVNVQAMAEAYRELERKMHAASDPAAAAAQAAAAKAAEKPEIETTVAAAAAAQAAGATTFAEALSGAAAPAAGGVDWKAAEAELAVSGTFKVETVTKLKAAGVPETVIIGMVNGHKARQQVIFSQAAELVGGQGNLQAALAYAKANYTAEQKQALQQALGGPLSAQTLRGLWAEAQQAGGAGEGQQVDTSAQIGGGITPKRGTIKPFLSQQEMMAAMNDPRYKFDPAYQGEVAARAAVAKGVSQERAALLLNR